MMFLAILPLLSVALAMVPAPLPVLLPRDTDLVGAVSPNLTCGTKDAGGSPNAYTCPTTAPCCSAHGFCGTGDSYCVNTAGCQASFSATAASCYAPKDGVTISPDGTCGKTGAGSNGYRCDQNSTNMCCSAS
ncbi:hypothetical protein GQ53DRAFT_755017 [Thozetella sp. PMI_491]|nr:hypothetical protein GQ53DRAFT_755017 [Thozetella sp. PMI_491]